MEVVVHSLVYAEDVASGGENRTVFCVRDKLYVGGSCVEVAQVEYSRGYRTSLPILRQMHH